MPRLLLVDGSNYLFRAYHALPPLMTSNGEPTGAIKGFNGMLKNVASLVQPDYKACIFDAPGKNFRHAIFADYKANRPPMPDDLRVQIEPIMEMVRLSGWPLIQIAGVEADDVLATYAKRADALSWDVFIATGDKDLAQLVDGRIRLVNTMTRQVLDAEGVKAKYGVAPDRIIDYLALMGDKVDNVPGINKCGPVTAAKWINEWGSLDNLVAHAGEVKGKIGENLRAGLPFLETARKLVTINCAVELPSKPEELVAGAVDEEKLTAFFTRWEMRAGAAKTGKPKSKAAAAATVAPVQTDLFAAPADTADAVAVDPAQAGSFETVDDAEKLNALIARLTRIEPQEPPVAVTLLTDRMNPLHDVTVGIGLAVTPLERYYLPVTHEKGKNLAAHDIKRLASWFASDAPKVMHDLKYARHVLRNFGITECAASGDAMLMSYVLEAHLKHDLQKLAARYCAVALPSEEDFLGKGAQKKKVSQMPAAAVGAFLTTAAACLRTAAAVMKSRMAADAGLTRIYETIELPVCAVLGKMERTGVDVDIAKLKALSSAMGEEIEGIEAKIQELAGDPFNPASPKQLADVLFNKLGLPVKKKTASGTPSTDEEVLTELALDYPLPKLILDYRRLTKLKGTYTDKLPLMADPADGRIHTTFGQATAVTGRLASSDPNLQNIPVRSPEGRKIREAFVAPAGSRIISADYSQIELRIMAHISGDEGLLKAFRNGEDIHRATAAEVFGVAPENVTADERRMAKVINFGLIYGMSAFGLAQNLGVARSVAANYIEQYFARYPKVAKYMEETRLAAHRDGFVETAFGRRLWLPDIRSARAQMRAAAERAAINAPMQGTAADLIKMAMTAVSRWLTENKLESRMVLQVHDELVLEVPEKEVAAVSEALPRLMASVASLSVPLIAQVGVADNWEAAH